MANLWYTMDEVRDFHPQIETVLRDALNATNLSTTLEVVHHPSISGSSTTPDFGLRVRNSGRFIFIIEVKRERRDCDSHRVWNTTRGYVKDLTNQWQPNVYQYFAVTNAEVLNLFCERQGSINNCVLANNPHDHGHFGINPPHDASHVLSQLTNTLESIIQNIMRQQNPQWQNDWPPIISSLDANYRSIMATIANVSPDVSKELSLYEMLRLLIYNYLKEIYTQNGHANASQFHNFVRYNMNIRSFLNSILNNYQRILRIDFLQIFKNHPNTTHCILPRNLTTAIASCFDGFLRVMDTHIRPAVRGNPAPPYFFDIITDKIYDRQEMHNQGKIMTDPELSSILAELCIESDRDVILDPCCGDGALLDAAYDKLETLVLSNNQSIQHNVMLTKFHGFEIDSFLTQLASFRLLSKNIMNVNNQTDVSILNGDTFDNPGPGRFDVVLMNPPFMRNDDPRTPITLTHKDTMINAIEGQGGPSFIRNTSQPNLYFYFLEWIYHYLKDNGRAAIILMAKFLNSIDGEHVKNFLLNKVESIVLYPRNYFEEFRVTTCVVKIKKTTQPVSHIKFLRIINCELLTSPSNITTLLANNQDTITADYSLRCIPRNAIDPAQNWKLFLLDPQDKDQQLRNLNLLTDIQNVLGQQRRGVAGNSGGSNAVFIDSRSNPLRSHVVRIESNFVGFGMRVNKLMRGARRHVILTNNCLNAQRGLHVPSRYDQSVSNGLSTSIAQTNPGINSYYTEAKRSLNNWDRIVNDCYNSKARPMIIIPRGAREKHIVFYNPFHNSADILMSTNFFYFSGLLKNNPEIDLDSQLKFICGFLMSSFGQIQLELTSANQEGNRKLEGFMIERLRVPDPTKINISHIRTIAQELDRLDTLNIDIVGDEPITNNPRRNLDLAVGRMIYANNNLGFASLNDLVNFFELFLEELVVDRRI